MTAQPLDDRHRAFGLGGAIAIHVVAIALLILLARPLPEPPAPPPGVPGVSGIDPIAAGCTTVCIGGMPPVYVPGPPAPAPPPSVTVDGLGKRNSPQELTLAAAKRSAAAFAPIKCPW